MVETRRERTCIRNKRKIVERAYASIGVAYLRKLSAGATRLRPRACLKRKNVLLGNVKTSRPYIDICVCVSVFVSVIYLSISRFGNEGDNAERWSFEETLKSAFWRVVSCYVTQQVSIAVNYGGGVLSRCLLVAPSIDSMPFCTRFMQPLLPVHVYLFKRLCIQDR